jgi:hypothetical protein
MKKLMINIVTINPQNISLLVLVVSAIVWLAIWLILITDISRKPRSMLWKFPWILLSSIPVIGGVVYAANELIMAEWGKAFHWRNHNATKKPK